MATIPAEQSASPPVLSCDEALRIANQDAIAAYGDLSAYRITLIRRQDGWYIDYDLVGSALAGGGPHYVIDLTTGAILHKRYEQ